jgi:hypothetical protein
MVTQCLDPTPEEVDRQRRAALGRQATFSGMHHYVVVVLAYTSGIADDLSAVVMPPPVNPGRIFMSAAWSSSVIRIFV